VSQGNEPADWRVEVAFNDETSTIEILQIDAHRRRQRVHCTFEQWEQINYAVEHLFAHVDLSENGWEAVRDVVGISCN
jgi:hypothetical protein